VRPARRGKKGSDERHYPCIVQRAMNIQDTGVDDRDEWRERIMSALRDLRGDDSCTVRRMREDARDDACAESGNI
jgi:hypothetical protein